MTHGLTQRGCTGVMVPVVSLPPAEPDGLKASAVALTVTLLGEAPQKREKKLGKPAWVSCTVTMGLTPKAEVARVVQSEVAVPTVPSVPAE